MNNENNVLPDNPSIQVLKAGQSGIFTNYIYKAIPLAFDESMSYYETLLGLLNYLKNVILPTVNNNAEALVELQNLYIELNDYVEHYFENLDVQQEINNKLDEMAQNNYFKNLIENTVGNYKRLYNASFGINGWWTNSNGTKRSDRYNYRDNGITAIYQDIDDYAEIGLTEMCFTIQLNRTNEGFTISGGEDFLDDLLLASSYAENKGINVDTIRIMGTTTSTPILNSDQKTSYINIIDTILDKFSDSKYKYINVLNELHTTILDDNLFALTCLNKISQANKNSIVSIELYGEYSNNSNILEFLQYNVDVIGLNAYPRCVAYKDRLNAKLLDDGVLNLYNYMDKIQSLNKPIFIMETGVVDVYAALIRTSLSTTDIPEAIRINSYGLTEKELMLSFFKYFGNNVDRIYNWWTSGLTYPLECKINAKKLCQALLQKGRD